MAVSANRLELLQIADAVAREKNIDRMVVIEAMQDAMEKAAKGRYGAETEIKVEINPRSGETRMWRLLEIVDEVEEPSRQVNLKLAQVKNPTASMRSSRTASARSSTARSSASNTAMSSSISAAAKRSSVATS